MSSELGEYLLSVLLCCLMALVILRSHRIVAALGRVLDAGEERIPGARPDRPPPPPMPGFARPIELIAHDVRRLRLRYYSLPQRGIAYAKIQGVRRAYDGALIEACTALEMVTLLGVLPEGQELDHERERVEHLLSGVGFWRDADAA